MVEQGSLEWKLMRAGKVTASRISDVMAKIKTGEAAGRRNYRAELVAERLSGQPSDSFVSAPMRWGVEQEVMARAEYELRFGVFIDQVDFVDHPTLPSCGASPDGLVCEDGLVEIKCPNTSTHIEYLKAGRVPPEYVKQMQWQMEVTGRDWCDFVSFDPRMPASHQLFVRCLMRDDDMLKEIRAEVVAFEKEVAAEVAAVLASIPVIGPTGEE